MTDAPGLIDRSEEFGTYKRIHLTLNQYGLVKMLVGAGFIQDDKFTIEFADFDDERFLEISLIRFDKTPLKTWLCKCGNPAKAPCPICMAGP